MGGLGLGKGHDTSRLSTGEHGTSELGTDTRLGTNGLGTDELGTVKLCSNVTSTH
jgi:hypothetical protein